MRFLRVGNASASGGELAAFEIFGVAHRVFAEVHGLDRALDGKTVYCSSSPETTYQQHMRNFRTHNASGF